jgi:hypothetical protein
MVGIMPDKGGPGTIRQGAPNNGLAQAFMSNAGNPMRSTGGPTNITQPVQRAVAPPRRMPPPRPPVAPVNTVDQQRLAKLMGGLPGQFKMRVNAAAPDQQLKLAEQLRMQYPNHGWR